MSEWQESANRRRAFRQGGHEPEPDPERKWRGKKNRARWCKGRVGVSHDFMREDRPRFGGRLRVYIDKCRSCGREVWHHTKIVRPS